VIVGGGIHGRIVAVVATAVLLSGCGTSTVTPPPGGSATASDGSRPPSGLAHFQGDGWSFDHPAAWRFSAVEDPTSFSSSVGYLGTIVVNPDDICQHSGGEAPY
jgi:hypothetical protein